MAYLNKDEVLNRVKEHNEIAVGLGYEVIGTFLQGSFNYGDNMSDEQSDVDTKCLVVPSFEDLCLNKKAVSYTHICDNNEHIDLKDFRLYLNCFRKQNINFVEILFTQYFVVNPKYSEFVQLLIDNRDKIARYNNYATLNCMYGMAMEKYKALEHPYPATLDKIEKYGFDGKQLSHIIRLNEFAARWVNNEPYSECLISNQQDYIRDIKRNKNISLEEARKLSSDYCHRLKNLKEDYMNKNNLVIDSSVDDLFDEFSVEVLKKYLKGAL